LYFLHHDYVVAKLEQHFAEEVAAPIAAHRAANASFNVFIDLRLPGCNDSGAAMLNSAPSSNNSAAAAAAAMHFLTRRQPNRWDYISPPGAMQLLLAAVETALCQQLGQLSADSAQLQESAAQLAGIVARRAAACHAFLQRAQWAGAAAVQLIKDKEDGIKRLLQAAEDLQLQREQQRQHMLLLQQQLVDCLQLLGQSRWLFHTVEMQLDHEAECMRRLGNARRQRLQQQQERLLDQVSAGVIAWGEYNTQMQPLTEQIADVAANVAAVQQWQQQQQQELQRMRDDIGTVADVLSTTIKGLQHGFQVSTAQQESAEAAADAAVKGWCDSLQLNLHRRTFRPSFSSSSSSSGGGGLHGLDSAAIVLPIVISLEQAKAKGLHVESVRQQQQSLLGTARGIAAAGLGLLQGFGLQLPCIAALQQQWDLAAAAADAADAAAADRSHPPEFQDSLCWPQQRLLLQALQLGTCELVQLAVLLQYIGGVVHCAANDGESASHHCRRPQRHQSNSALFARGRLAQVLTAETEQKPAADLVQNAAGSSSSKGAAQHVLWQLLLAVRPAACAAVHCLQPLPPRCINFGAFVRAALDWENEMGGALGYKHSSKHGTAGSSENASSASPCQYCGQDGYDYTASVSSCFTAAGSAAEGLSVLAGVAQPSSGSSSSSVRAVCGSNLCVADELQQLARMGPPAALMTAGDWRVLCATALQDLKLRTGDCDDSSLQQQKQQLQHQSLRAMHVKLCEVR
jgi:hypothetical protein